MTKTKIVQRRVNSVDAPKLAYVMSICGMNSQALFSPWIKYLYANVQRYEHEGRDRDAIAKIVEEHLEEWNNLDSTQSLPPLAAS